jgi:hypothetical protein
LIAAESVTPGSTLWIWWPLESRIARTVIVASLKPTALRSERGLYSLESSINSPAPISLQAHLASTGI